MGKIENRTKPGEYYIGLDVGTNSVGWSVTDPDYNILKFKGNAMWGIRLFEEAMDATERGGFRSARRRLSRRNQRLLLLELLFSEEIAKTDPNFFVRLKESSLHFDDKTTEGKYSLFCDKGYTDKDYLKQYPTIYHLRSELIHSDSPHDVRLVFLALHHIIKNRGHFLFDSDLSSDNKSVKDSLEELNTFLLNEYNQSLTFADIDAYASVLEKSDIGITAKKKLLRTHLGTQPEAEYTEFDPYVLSDMLSGASVKFSDLFNDETLKDADIKSLSLKADLDEVYDNLCEILGDRIELIVSLKSVFDAARLSQILGGNAYVSDAKIELFNKNKADLNLLKKFVRTYCPEKYKYIFSNKKDKLNNYTAYSRYNLSSGDYTCNQEEFCAFLKSALPELKTNSDYKTLYDEIENKTFLTRLTGTANSVIPNQLHLKELKIILENASAYLPFLNVKDADGFTVSEKIISIFIHRIPYYVGPLNPNSPNKWVVRTGEKIYPWNFDKVVDIERSAENFIINLIGRCTYTGDYVLPKDSLLYSEFMVRNEINLLRVNGKEVPRDVMDSLYNDLFVNSGKKVTKKIIREYLESQGCISATDELSGIDDVVKSKLKSLSDFGLILDKTKDYSLVEEIIKRILLFGEDKKMLRNWLKKNCPMLDKKDYDYICRLKYKDWGRLSKEFLTETYHIDESGEAFSIMDLLRTKNVNIMQLLSSEYQFGAEAEKKRVERVGGNKNPDQLIDEMYISPAVRRSVRQALKIVEEIVAVKKSAPKKIFIEVARERRDDLKGKRTVSRKDKLIELYKACGEDSGILFEKLCSEDEGRLRRDKIYLYYTQFGKCMYSKEEIDFEALISENSNYDIDHIFPRSRIKDDSIDNRVLVKATLNREKTNIYPIDEAVRTKMYPFWKMLKEKGLISEKKFIRLTRQTPLTEKELSDFVARQVVETQQSTKAIASLMRDIYPNTKLVYSKAGNVSDFRKQFGFVKCREINDLHHAKDAYLNIVVGNVYDTKFTENFFRNIRNENYSLNRVFDYCDVPGAWVLGKTIVTVKKYMAKNNILMTRMPREVKGQISDLQIMSAGKGQLPIKQGKDIAKYGGYNKVSGAYFFVVEHTEKKKRIRTIEPVYIYMKKLYETNPLKYCSEVLELIEPKIIAPIIRIDSLLELNGMRLHICGRQGRQIIYKHSYELVIDELNEKYIKYIIKYIERCLALKKELPITAYDQISREENIKLYEWFMDKLNKRIYLNLFENVVADMKNNEEKFKNLSTYDQCKLLLEILKFFKCNRQTSDFSILCGKGTVGTILYGKNICRCESACLVNQSVTGLYETKFDLLK